MKSLKLDVNIVSSNTHVRIKIYREFYRGIIYVDNKGRHARITYVHH